MRAQNATFGRVHEIIHDHDREARFQHLQYGVTTNVSGTSSDKYALRGLAHDCIAVVNEVCMNICINLIMVWLKPFENTDGIKMSV